MALPTKCQLCKATVSHQHIVTSHVYGRAKDSGYAFYHCQSCDVRYQFPQLSSEEEEKFYANEFEKFMESRAGETGGWQKAEEHVKANEDTRLRRMKYLEPHLKNKKNILEIGCSSGFMLYPLRKKGHNCIGIEPSGVFNNFVKSNELVVYDSTKKLVRDNPKIKFDLIMHFFVLEHIGNPINFFLEQLSLLKPNGKIIFEIPNAADPLYTIYDIPAFERFYWSLAHPWYFSHKSLEYLLNKLRRPFKIQLDQRYDLSNHMVWARDGVPGGMGKLTHLLGEELENDYKNNLIKIGKCDTLIGIISKGS